MNRTVSSEQARTGLRAVRGLYFAGPQGRKNQRWIRADPPLAKAFTCSTVAIVVSPGNVVSRAPCAQPRFTASCSGCAGQQAVDEAGGIAVAATDAVQHVQFARGRHVGLAVDPCHRTPAVAVGGMNLAQRGGHDFHLRMLPAHILHHAKEGAGIQFRPGGHLGSGNAQAQLQVLLVADEDVDVLHDAVEHGDGPVVTADNIPQL